MIALDAAPPTAPIPIMRQLTVPDPAGPAGQIIREYGARMDATARRFQPANPSDAAAIAWGHQQRLTSLTYWYWAAATEVAKSVREQGRYGAVRTVVLNMRGRAVNH